MTQTRKKLVFSWVLILAMVISVISPGSVAFVNAEEAYDGYVYVTVERFTLGQGLACEPKKIGYKEGENFETVLKRGYGEDSLVTSDGQYGFSFDGFVDGGEPEGWSVDQIPIKILDALGVAGEYTSAVTKEDIENRGRQNAGTLSNYDYTGQSYLMLCVDNQSASYGISDLKSGTDTNGSAFHDGSVLRVEFGIYSYGGDLNIAYGTPLIDFPDKDELIKQIVDFSGDKKSAVYTDAIAVLEDWDANENEVEEAEAALKIENAKAECKAIYSEALSNSKEKLTVPAYGNEWTVLSIARGGLSDAKWNYQYIKSVSEKVKELNSNELKKNEATENAKITLILNSVGGNPENVEGFNLLEPLANYDYVKKQGVNGIIYTLLALDSRNYEIPKLSGEGTQTTREVLINGILDAQIEGGGWDWTPTATTPDPDLSGMALQALAPYYDSNNKVKEAVDNVVKLLSDKQDSDGGYSSWGYANSCSCAQVICGLSELGIDAASDERFIKNGTSLLEAALAYYNKTDKGFNNYPGDKESATYSTDQVLYALTAYDRMINKKTGLYNFTDVHQHKISVKNAKEATCTAVGYTGDKVCDDCGEVLEKGTEIAKKAHTPVEIPAVAATETTPGKTAGKKCSVCGEILEEPTVILETGKPSGIDGVTDAPAPLSNKNCSIIDGEAKTALYYVSVKKETKVIIPDTVSDDYYGKGDYKVTALTGKASDYNKVVTEVSVGKNVEEIKEKTFTNCTKLKKVTFRGTKLKKIGASAFKGNKSLTSLDLSKNKVTTIGKEAFSGCKKLKTFKINGNKLTKVGKNAFKNIKKNAKIIIYAKNKKTYKKVKKLIEKSGAKNVKYQYKNKK